MYAGSNLPSSYRPEQGEALLFSVRGGQLHYSEMVKEPSVQFVCWAPDDVRAMHMAEEVLYRVLNGAQTATIASARQDGQPQGPFRDPTTNWTFALVFYDIKLKVRDRAASQGL
jgi:hypothetical protein